MSSLLGDLFGVSKPIIAMVHLPALPGRPRHDRAAGMRPVVDAAARDLGALQAAGVDGLLFCNEADLPYQLGVGPETAAAMAAVIGAVRSEISRPFGVDLVWDPVASLAVARATGACFVREVFTGVYESDLGIMRPDFGSICAYRAGIGAGSVALLANITPEFASPLGGAVGPEQAERGAVGPEQAGRGAVGPEPAGRQRTIAERARSAVYLGVDAVLISGPITGTATDTGQLRAAKAAVPRAPVLANTGVTADTVPEILSVADGAIVGTYLKRGGVTWNPVDPARAARLMAAARRARESVVTG